MFAAEISWEQHNCRSYILFKVLCPNLKYYLVQWLHRQPCERNDESRGIETSDYGRWLQLLLSGCNENLIKKMYITMLQLKFIRIHRNNAMKANDFVEVVEGIHHEDWFCCSYEYFIKKKEKESTYEEQKFSRDLFSLLKLLAIDVKAGSKQRWLKLVLKAKRRRGSQCCHVGVGFIDKKSSKSKGAAVTKQRYGLLIYTLCVHGIVLLSLRLIEWSQKGATSKNSKGVAAREHVDACIYDVD